MINLQKLQQQEKKEAVKMKLMLKISQKMMENQKQQKNHLQN